MATAHGVPQFPIVMISGDADLSRSVEGGYGEALGGPEGVRRLSRQVAAVWRTGSLPTDEGEDR